MGLFRLKSIKKLAKITAKARDGKTNATNTQAVTAAATETPEQKAVREQQEAVATASAITDSGRKTDIVNSVTNKPAENISAAPAESGENLGLYINDLRNRRRKRGAPLPENTPTLGISGILGG